MDSISHAWDELLDYHSKLSGNSFANWSKVTPRQKAFTDKMLQCNAHVIATMRTKQDYVLNLKDGKYIPEKVGLKAVQRDGLDYEFTLVFDIDIKHFASASKDRTGLYMDKPMVSISEKTGQDILNWCKGSKEPGDNNISIPTRNDIERKISLCQDTTELVDLYNQNPLYQKSMNKAFVERKQILNEMSNTQNFINNGYATNY